MRRVRGVVLAILAVTILAGAGLGLARRNAAVAETGFVNVKTTFSLPGSDAYLLGPNPLEPLNKGAPGEGTFTERVGPAKLQLRRQGQLLDLCELTVRPNRITTVTVVAVNNRIGCRIDA